MANIIIEHKVTDLEKFEKLVKDLQTTMKGGKVTGESVQQAQQLLNTKKQILELSEEEKIHQRELTREEQLRAKVVASAPGSYNRINAELNQLINAQKKLNLETKSGQQEWKENQRLITQYDRKLKEMDASMGRHQRNVGNYTGAIREGFAKAAIAVAGVVAAYRTIERVIGGSIKAGMESIQSQEKLRASLGKNAEALKELITLSGELQYKYLIEDETIQSIQSYFAVQKRTKDEIIKLTEATIAYAAVTGDDLFDAARKIDPIMEGNIGRLGKMDDSWKDLIKTQGGAIKVIDEIINKYGKAAFDAITKQERDVKTLKIAWKELLEESGKAAVNTGFATFLGNLAEGLKNINIVLAATDLTKLQKLDIIISGKAGYYAEAKKAEVDWIKMYKTRGEKLANIEEKNGVTRKSKFDEMDKYYKEQWDKGFKNEANAYKIAFLNKMVENDKQANIEKNKKGKLTEDEIKALKERIEKENEALKKQIEEKKKLYEKALKDETDYTIKAKKYIYEKQAELAKAANKQAEDAQDNIDKRVRTRVKGQAEEENGIAKDKKQKQIDTETEATEAVLQILGIFFKTSESFARDNAKAMQLISIAQIMINQAETITKAWRAIKSLTGWDWFIQAAAIAGGIIGAFAPIISMAQGQKFTKGKIDIQGPGTETSDSILSWLSVGESITSAEKTKKYKPALEAIHKDHFDEYVYVNYVMPEMNREAKADIDRGTAKNMYDNLKLNAVLDDLEIRRKIGESNLLLSKIVKNTKYQKNIIR